MFREMCRAKLHRVRVTQTELDYEGSITIDEELMEAADILPAEKLDIYNITNGARFSTYAIRGERGSGVISINGAAARLADVGDELIVISYAVFPEEETKTLKPKIIKVDEKNRLLKV